MRAAGLLVGLALAGGCLGTTPGEELADQQGEDPAGDEGPTHRPGQRCLVCHESDFVVAGTVYRRADDAAGLEGAEVEISDDRGRVFTAVTNRAGNFMLSVGEVDEDKQGQGWVGLRDAPSFPLRVVVRHGTEERRMRNVVHREGACAACHDRHGKGAASNGKVFVEETP